VDLDGFVRDGYVAIRGAVDAGTAAACRELIWAAMERRGVRQDDPGSWPPLVEGMDDLTGEPLLAAYTAPALTAAYDQLIGPGRWERAMRSVRSADIGQSVVVRFPAEDERANAGYHIEGSYDAPDGSSAGWVNIRSRNRGLLALILFTDVFQAGSAWRIRAAASRISCGPMVIVRPPWEVVHWAASGQVRQATPNLAVPTPRPAGAPMGMVMPAGQVTVPACRSMPKRSLGKWPFGAGGGCTLMPARRPASSTLSSSSPDP